MLTVGSSEGNNILSQASFTVGRIMESAEAKASQKTVRAVSTSLIVNEEGLLIRML